MLVRIIYKSGATIDLECDRFDVERSLGGGFAVEWEGAKPAPLLIGVDEIAAVFWLDPTSDEVA